MCVYGADKLNHKSFLFLTLINWWKTKELYRFHRKKSTHTANNCLSLHSMALVSIKSRISTSPVVNNPNLGLIIWLFHFTSIAAREHANAGVSLTGNLSSWCWLITIREKGEGETGFRTAIAAAATFCVYAAHNCEWARFCVRVCVGCLHAALLGGRPVINNFNPCCHLRSKGARCFTQLVCAACDMKCNVSHFGPVICFTTR